ncbi:hypothetical protein NYR90_00310 [Clostridioides difficile]|nr:hypothetical protein NYR90_00310 [Clostridioides difficile]
MENLNIGELFNESIKTIILQEVKNAKKEIEKEISKEKIVLLMQRGYPNELLSARVSRERLSVGTETLKDLIDLNLIPIIKNKKKIKISSYDLDDFIEKYKNQDLKEVIEEARNRKGGDLVECKSTNSLCTVL